MDSPGHWKSHLGDLELNSRPASQEKKWTWGKLARVMSSQCGAGEVAATRLLNKLAFDIHRYYVNASVTLCSLLEARHTCPALIAFFFCLTVSQSTHNETVVLCRSCLQRSHSSFDVLTSVARESLSLYKWFLMKITFVLEPWPPVWAV